MSYRTLPYRTLSYCTVSNTSSRRVQFVQRVRDGAEFAVKFFFTPRGFEQEAAHYANPRLAGLLAKPVLSTANADGAIVSGGGYVFPAMIVVERGEVRFVPNLALAICCGDDRRRARRGALCLALPMRCSGALFPWRFGVLPICCSGDLLRR